MFERQYVNRSELQEMFPPLPPPDLVNNPSHYMGKYGLEAIDVIEAFDLNYYLGNAIKYILRAGKKDDECQDLKKAVWYLQRMIDMKDHEDE